MTLSDRKPFIKKFCHEGAIKDRTDKGIRGVCKKNIWWYNIPFIIRILIFKESERT